MKFLIFILITAGLIAQENMEAELYKLLYSGNYNSLSTRLQTMLASDSSNAELYFLLGLTNTYQNKKSNSLQNLEQACILDSTNIKMLRQYALTLSSSGHAGRAEKIFNKAIQLDSTRNDIWESLAMLHYRNSKIDDALQIYANLSETDSTNAYYYLMQARCTAKIDDSGKAIDFYKLAYAYDPENVTTIIELANNYFNQDSLDAALDMVGLGLPLAPKNNLLHRLKANVLYKQKDYTSATLSFLDAIAFGDQSADVLKKLGYCYFADENYAKAKEILEQAIQLDNNPILYYYLGLSSMKMDLHEQAINHFNTALHLIYPDYLESLYFSLAECYRDEEKYGPAIHALKKAKEFSTSKGIIFYQLANVYYDYYKDKSVAKLYYKKAAEYDLDPEILEFIDYRINEITKDIFFAK